MFDMILSDLYIGFEPNMQVLAWQRRLDLDLLFLEVHLIFSLSIIAMLITPLIASQHDSFHLQVR